MSIILNDCFIINLQTFPQFRYELLAACGTVSARLPLVMGFLIHEVMMDVAKFDIVFRPPASIIRHVKQTWIQFQLQFF